MQVGSELERRRGRAVWLRALCGKRVVREPVPIVQEEPLKVELESFVHCVEKKHAPVVTGESARQAIELALEITRQIQEQSD